jgi:putative ABC transport system permease protein
VEAFFMAWDSIRANKLRSALTLLGMVVGVFAIISSVTAVRVIEVYFDESLSMLGSQSFSISRHPTVQMDGRGRPGYRPPVTYDQVRRLDEMISIPVTVSPEAWFSMTSVRFQSRETDPNVLLIGSNEYYPLNFGFEIAEGRGLSDQDVQFGRPVVVIGSDVSERLFPNEHPVGKQVIINGSRFQVVGVLSAKGSFLGMNWDRRVIAPITTLFGIYGRPNRNMGSVSIRATSPQAVPAAMDHAIGHMRTIRKVPPGEPNSFEVETNASVRGAFDQFTRVLTLGGAGIGLIALLAAGIGIMNIMLVSVTERTREIGIRKSIGARRRDIMRQFLLEAFFLCQIGGLLGVIAGVGFGNLVAVRFDISAAIPYGWVVIAVVMVTGIALLFGGYPALKAARLHPIESLRFE